jgi:hypothetical protein
MRFRHINENSVKINHILDWFGQDRKNHKNPYKITELPSTKYYPASNKPYNRINAYFSHPLCEKREYPFIIELPQKHNQNASMSTIHELPKTLVNTILKIGSKNSMQLTSRFKGV